MLLSVIVENQAMTFGQTIDWFDFANIEDSWDEKYFRNPM